MEINFNDSETSAHVVEATDQDFEQKVLNRSRQIPVLVDFWAPWCGPCKVIGPVLEKLAGQSSGRFELVKVNMDESPMLAQALRIQSIPAVKLFINAAIKDEFMGAYPEPEVVRFLEHNLPSEAVEDAVQGLRLWQQGDTAGAARVFQQVLQEDPKNSVALIGLGHLQMDQGQLEQAQELAGRVDEVELERLSERQRMEKLLGALRARIYLTEQAQDNGSEDSELAVRYRDACHSALLGDFEQALEAFLQIVSTDRAFQEDGGRLAMLAVFELLPPDSALLHTYRGKLSNILFS